MNSMLNVRPSVSGFPVDMSSVNALWVGSIIDQHRFRSHQDRILARYETPCADGEFFPCEERLAALGINVNSLATCLDEGTITAERVAELVADLESGRITAEEFDDTVSLTLVPASAIATLGSADAATYAAHMPDVLEAARIHPDDHIDRALHSKGLCSCHVEFVA
jgi:hypothetical protein